METLYLTQQISTAFPEALNMAITTNWKRREGEAKPLFEGFSKIYRPGEKEALQLNFRGTKTSCFAQGHQSQVPSLDVLQSSPEPELSACFSFLCLALQLLHL